MRYFLSPIYEREGSSHVMYAFFNGSRVAKRIGTGAWQYYMTDHLGSIRAVLDANGTVTKRINYLPFGAIKSMSVGTLPGYLFNGNRKNAYGVYDYGARGYLPYLGVFTQPDDIVPDQYAPQALNRFSYVLNNPVNRIDPTGHESYGGQGLDPTSGFGRWVNARYGTSIYGIIASHQGGTRISGGWSLGDGPTLEERQKAKDAAYWERRKEKETAEAAETGGVQLSAEQTSILAMYLDSPVFVEGRIVTVREALIKGVVAGVGVTAMYGAWILLAPEAGGIWVAVEQRLPALMERAAAGEGIAVGRAAGAAEQFASAIQRYGNGPLTNVGRALTKHPNVVGETGNILQSLGGARSVNDVAARALTDIMQNGTMTTKMTQAFGQVVEYRLPSGIGARFAADTNAFIGFLGRWQ